MLNLGERLFPQLLALEGQLADVPKKRPPSPHYMVFKRRSSTRVGRGALRTAVRHDRVDATYASEHRTETKISRPLLHGIEVYRLIDPPSGQTFAEEWTHGYWRPSLVAIELLRTSQLAPNDLLAERGVPPCDWLPHPNVGWETPKLVRLVGNVAFEHDSVGGADAASQA